jgi:hypothetical protein
VVQIVGTCALPEGIGKRDHACAKERNATKNKPDRTKFFEFFKVKY